MSTDELRRHLLWALDTLDAETRRDHYVEHKSAARAALVAASGAERPIDEEQVGLRERLQRGPTSGEAYATLVAMFGRAAVPSILEEIAEAIAAAYTAKCQDCAHPEHTLATCHEYVPNGDPSNGPAYCPCSAEIEHMEQEILRLRGAALSQQSEKPTREQS